MSVPSVCLVCSTRTTCCRNKYIDAKEDSPCPPMLKPNPNSSSLDVGRAVDGGQGGAPAWLLALGWVGLIWHFAVVAVCALGYFQL